MRFGAPGVLMWLLLLPVVWWLAYFLLSRRLLRLQSLADPATWRTILPDWEVSRARRRLALWLAAVYLLSFALARPQWGFHWEETHRRGLELVVVLDTSKSMLAEDIKPNRFQQAKWGIRDLVRLLSGDRIGLVAFSGSSFLQCPLTVDYAAFLMTLDDLYVGIIPRGGTAIEQALRTAIDTFEHNGEADRAVVLITDGENHEGNPLLLIDELRKLNIRVYAVGVGTLDGDLIPAETEAGDRSFLKDSSGAVVKSALTEDALERLALQTGGTYVRSAAGDFGLDRIVDEGIAKLKRQEQDSRMVKTYEDRAGWFIALAILLLALEAGMSEQSRPRRAVRSARLLLLALAVIPTANELAAAGDPRQLMDKGADAYRKRDFERAAEAFATAAEDAPSRKLDPAPARLNEGNALFRLQRLQDADRAYGDASRSDDMTLQSRAYYNRANAMLGMAAARKDSQQDPSSALKLAEQALSLYEKSILLAPTDEDAKVNYEIALTLKQKLEQQQRQQQQPDQNDQQDQQQPQPKEEPKPDEQRQQEQQQGQGQPSQQEQDQQAQQPEQQQPAPQPSEEMTPQEALLLLDAMKQDEQARREQLRIDMGRAVPVDKDW